MPRPPQPALVALLALLLGPLGGGAAAAGAAAPDGPPPAGASPAGASRSDAADAQPREPPPDATPPPAGGAQAGDEAYLAAPVQPAAAEPVGSRLIDLATPSTIGRRRLELLVTHRFNQPVNQGSSAHNLWGLDSGADVGIGFTYGLLRKLDLSVYRSQFQEDFELAAKLQVLEASPHLPLSAAVRAGADLLGRQGVQDPHRPFVQLLLGGHLAAGWNVFASPSWVRATPLLRDAWNVPVGLTAPLPGKWLLDGEVIAANHALHGMPGASRLAWHAAFAKQVGWHVFQIVLGNSRATTVDQIVGGDFAGGFTTRDVRLGFNLIRYFSP
ncbi:MAG: hypothetical protein JOZ15_08540 [Acidobacteria bacterium]|nr:hypothetical protein [Acidobacteriota bacterium]